MPRSRRYIKARAVYEIVFRAHSSLPFPCTDYMRLIIEGILARVQRDHKVVLHHYVLEGSHPHIIITAKDARQCMRFYAQLKKQITDAIKRLLGLKRLKLWEDHASVIEIPTLDDLILKISYSYLNPSNDDLSDSIDRYPGISSWSAFLDADSIDACVSSVHPWIRQPMISQLPSRSVTPAQDRMITREMKSRAKCTHTLRIYPWLWMELFKDELPEGGLAEVKQLILDCIRAGEADNRKRRELTNKRVMGKERLRAQPLLKAHTPKKKERKILVQSRFRDIRKALIEEFKRIDALCRAVYERWKQGDFSCSWPPGTFPPPLPPLANALQ
ncbi:MAG: hypothetical protein KDD44_01565 [Bdellovibrionales bacterium]|nr:hypothetical protein [Bdellovibrionales bacterium]